MRAAERIHRFADVDRELAELVVRGARRARVKVETLRSESKVGKLVEARRWVVARARPRWSYWAIGRALNRDHSTVVHHERVVRQLEAANDERADELSQ
jgi:chromosomal replication initiation ATPase DnaA